MQLAIPVHALGDERIHLALPHRGRLRQGQLKTLCGLQAVTELSPFVLAEKGNRCRTCFSMVNADGEIRTATETGARRKGASRGGGKV